MTNTETQAKGRTCRHCRETAADHCPGCNACPGQECPYWCDGPLSDED